MARFDLYTHPDGQGYLLDVQADLLADFNTRIVVPLLPKRQAPDPARDLNPVFVIEETDHVMLTQWMAAVPTAILGQPMATLAPHRDDITRALDMAFQGF